MKIKKLTIALLLCLPSLMLFGQPSKATKNNSANSISSLATMHPDRKTGFSNGGWNLDRYKELERLNAGKQIVVADLKGPGIITHIHTTRHNPKDILSRGIVLEIWFDDAREPAVMSPLADFFGDGCNGSSMNFSTPLIECAPWSYNCYFPMPFAKSARVILRNDSKVDCSNYSYVEWETLPEWDPNQGYFHATYRRDVFQLTKETDHMFFDIKGSGHFIGRQFSVVTDEPLWKGFGYVMEGNNEVDIDGQERRLDYLGSEDSFTFSWGFKEQFAGLRAGMPLIDKNKENTGISRLSIYRFHDHMPIRFNRSLQWHINWGMEWQFNNINPLKDFFNNGDENGKKWDPALKARNWDEALARGGCWVDYAHVFYWYQDQPGGFGHQPLPPVEERMKTLLRSSVKTAAPGEVKGDAK